MAPSVTADPLPYKLHTNRELEFMLEKGKPLAHFSDAYPSEPDEAILPELAFAPHVQAGRFVTREFVEPLQGPPPKNHPYLRGIRHVFYARATEAWRIDAYIMMMAAAAKAGWSEGFERLEGSLLGYEEWQTDAHMERLRASPHAKNFYWLRKPQSGVENVGTETAP
jgi:hypothetical protein